VSGVRFIDEGEVDAIHLVLVRHRNVESASTYRMPASSMVALLSHYEDYIKGNASDVFATVCEHSVVLFDLSSIASIEARASNPNDLYKAIT